MEGYGQYCPLANGAELFASRWTPLILRELLRGSTTFNDLHRGVPRMSRSLLSNRLKKLEACGVLERRLKGSGAHYELTPAGLELGPVVTQLGICAQRWYRSTFRGTELGPQDLRRRLRSWLRLSPYAPVGDARKRLNPVSQARSRSM